MADNLTFAAFAAVLSDAGKGKLAANQRKAVSVLSAPVASANARAWAHAYLGAIVACNFVALESVTVTE